MISSKVPNRKEGSERLSDLSKATIKSVAKWGLEPTSPGSHSSVALLHQPFKVTGCRHSISHALPCLFLKSNLV